MQSTMRNMAEHGEHTAYGKDTRRDIANKLTKFEDFAGHSMRGGWELDRSGYTVYRVYSYATIIGEWWPNHDGGTLHLNVTYYSNKTTEHFGYMMLHMVHYGLGSPHRPNSVLPYHIVEWDDVWGDTKALSDGTI